jgi:hypothetical protein
MNAHRYKVTVEHLYTPHAGDPLDPPLVFETTSQDALMLLLLVNRLRGQLGTAECEDFVMSTPPPRRRAATRPL